MPKLYIEAADPKWVEVWLRSERAGVPLAQEPTKQLALSVALQKLEEFTQAVLDAAEEIEE